MHTCIYRAGPRLRLVPIAPSPCLSCAPGVVPILPMADGETHFRGFGVKPAGSSQEGVSGLRAPPELFHREPVIFLLNHVIGSANGPEKSAKA